MIYMDAFILPNLGPYRRFCTFLVYFIYVREKPLKRHLYAQDRCSGSCVFGEEDQEERKVQDLLNLPAR